MSWLPSRQLSTQRPLTSVHAPERQRSISGHFLTPPTRIMTGQNQQDTSLPFFPTPSFSNWPNIQFSKHPLSTCSVRTCDRRWGCLISDKPSPSPQEDQRSTGEKDLTDVRTNVPKCRKSVEMGKAPSRPSEEREGVLKEGTVLRCEG